MMPLRTVELESIFTHERTGLYRRTRELHAFAVGLEVEVGSPLYLGALARYGLLAMLSTASAGVAPTDRVRARHMAAIRERLARFASVLRAVADRGLVDTETIRFGSQLVRHTEEALREFEGELRCVEAELLSERSDKERAKSGARPDDEIEAPPMSAIPPEQVAGKAVNENSEAVSRSSQDKEGTGAIRPGVARRSALTHAPELAVPPEAQGHGTASATGADDIAGLPEGR
jgi:hypothetical protein